MKQFLGFLASAVLLAIAIKEVVGESQETLGFGPAILLLTFGIVMWFLLSKVSNQKIKSSLFINSALWLHSIFEGALAALGFSFGVKAGLIIIAVLFLHLLPESLAIITALKHCGANTASAVKSYLISIGLLIISFAAFSFISQINASLIVSLSTVVGGGFIYIALNLIRKSWQTI